LKKFLYISLLLIGDKAVAQFDRLPFSFNIEAAVPKALGNTAFAKSFSGNLDYNASFTHHYKNKFETGLVFKRANFKAGYTGLTAKATNEPINTKFIYNGLGIRFFYTYYDNAYFYAQLGIAGYYCFSKYDKVTYKTVSVPDVKLNFFAFEPMANINYKASDYVDVGFQFGVSVLAYHFEPSLAYLNEANKIDYFPDEVTPTNTTHLSFGFTLKWYLQFEKMKE